MIGTASASSVPAPSGRGLWTIPALLVFGSAATAIAAIVGNGNAAVAVAPVLLLVGAALMWFAPLRTSLFVLIAVSLTIDATGDGPWSSPLAKLGDLLHGNLNQSLPLQALALPGVFVLLIYAFVIHIHRSLSGSRIDRGARGETAKPLLAALAISLLTVLWITAWGVARGGNLQMAKNQTQYFVLILLVAYLSAMSLRSLDDFRTLGRIVLATACTKALIAVWVVQTVVLPSFELNGRLAYATSHGDSILFAAATVMLIVRFAEQPVRRNGLFCLGLLPLLWAGMIANNRRLAYVEIGATLLTFLIISRRSRVKRLVVRTALAAVPVVLLYVAVGWNSQSQLFSPVHVFRSVGDGEVDSSTLYRDLENYNLIATMREAPVMGTGFGHPFAEVVPLPDISFFKEYRYLPHNSVLGLWAFCGPLGFTGLALALVVAVYLGSRSYQSARDPDERTAAFMTIAMVLIFIVHCWGDIGFTERRSMFLVGPALAMAGQLAVSTGAWRMRVTNRRRI